MTVDRAGIIPACMSNTTLAKNVACTKKYERGWLNNHGLGSEG